MERQEATQQTNEPPSVDVAERAVDRAFSTGKVDRAYITRQAQLDAAEAVAMAGIAMESDAEADEAAKITVIATNMGNRQKSKEARERERLARNKAKADHRAATKSAKQAYEAIKFSDPSKLGFIRVVQVSFMLHIIGTLAALILTSRDTVVYNSVNIIDWISVIVESIAFYFFMHRLKAGRMFVIVASAVGIVANVIFDLLHGTFSVFSIFGTIGYYLFLLLYFLFSKRVKAVLVNDLSSVQGVDEDEDFVIERGGWPFYRNLGIYFVVFSVLGHWMEAGMCQFIRLGLVQGDYDPNNTMLWRDWLYPYPMEGAAVVLIALLLYPLFLWLKTRFDNRLIPYALSFVANALTCTLIEFTGGMLFNAQLQNWDYSKLPFNFMGQVCLQNTIAFGVAASVIAWYVYPALERMIARVRPAIMNIVFVIVVVAGGILFSLYAISPPSGVDLGKAEEVVEQEEKTDQQLDVTDSIGLLSSLVKSSAAQVDKVQSLSEDERERAKEHLDAAQGELDEVARILKGESPADDEDESSDEDGESDEGDEYNDSDEEQPSDEG